MLPNFDKHTLVTAALLASITITGCGNKKDLIGPPPVPPQPQGQPSPDVKGGNLGGGLQGNGNPNSNPNGQAQSSPVAPKSSEPILPSNPNVIVDTKPLDPENVSKPPAYDPNDPKSVMQENLTKRLTGAVTQDGLLFTSSSTDNLMDFLRARNEKVDANTRRTNFEVAAAVRSAVLAVDPLSGDSIVTLKIQEGRDVKVYNLGGVSSYGGAAASLHILSEGNGEKSTGTRALTGTLKCVDLDGGCETTFVRLKINGASSSAIINLIFRNSSADLYFYLPSDQEQSSNPEFLTFQDYILNSIKQIDTKDKIKTVRMNSWEVVNGRSGINLSIKGYNDELVAFSGPLLAPEVGNAVNVVLSRVNYDQDSSKDMVSSKNTKLNYANSIGDARITANNGLGQVRIQLKMRKRGDYAQDVITVTFMRSIKPIVDLTDDNLQ
ncbi:MAG: hypothetical protein ACXVCP_18200 [Bdellovibrio sp.]